MNYRHYAARRLKVTEKGTPTGPWFYTVYGRDRDTGEETLPQPVGYCAAGCKGHDTAKEAYDHQEKYLLDTASFAAQTPGTQQPCMVCGTPTDRLVQTTMGPVDSYRLCDEHCNRVGLKKVFGDMGDVISSY